jgi:protein-disulfide isomerase
MKSFTSMMMLLLLLLLIININCAVPTVIGPPIPQLNDGLKFGTVAVQPKVIVQVYVDFTCDGSGEVWNEVIIPLLTIVNQKSLPVQFHIHYLPLPYHIAAFETLKAYILVNNIANQKYTFQFVNETFVNQEPILDVSSYNQAQIQQVIYKNYIEKLNIPIPKDQFVKSMNARDTWDHGRVIFKLATSSGIFGTPSFVVNGVNVYNAGDFSISDWVDLFQSL